MNVEKKCSAKCEEFNLCRFRCFNDLYGLLVRQKQFKIFSPLNAKAACVLRENNSRNFGLSTLDENETALIKHCASVSLLLAKRGSQCFIARSLSHITNHNIWCSSFWARKLQAFNDVCSMQITNQFRIKLSKIRLLNIGV